MKELSFQGKWRSYQQKVLEELATHLDNDHLHVVAAPGSGKTILGLEVMRQLEKPALILAPTITIRNQWEQRLVSMFMPEGSKSPDWISFDIKNPGHVTIITYQALYSAFAGIKEQEVEFEEQEEEGSEPKAEVAKANAKQTADVMAKLRDKGVQTIVLDEAHHLRNEWWKALTKLKEGLKKPSIVALTATPPYDVEYTEWQRYQELCGPIDAEISVPELVLQGDLCPHQDYVYFTLPRAIEAEKITQFRSEVAEFIKNFLNWEEFKNALLAHKWVANPKEHAEEILSDPTYFSSILIFLNDRGVGIPGRTLGILGVGTSSIPDLDNKWLEVLLNGTLYDYREDFSSIEKPLDEMQRHLKRIGALELRKVSLSNPKSVQKLLASSTSKLDAIVEITRLESGVMEDNLRMVILSDFIRKSELPKTEDDIRPIDKMGVAPIFESLRRARIGGVKLGVLSGSLIFIPASSKDLLMQSAKELGIAASHVKTSASGFDKDFLKVDITGEQRQNIVRLITELFGKGGITVLVGTQALLGEGWDAPSVNTLILASTVGSYMLSNQMRGRAIRIDRNHPEKASNIWHLAAVDPESLMEKFHYFRTGKTKRQKIFDPLDELQVDLGHDVNKLKRRFRAFEGLSYNEPPVIENGFRRLLLSKVNWGKGSVENINSIMFKKAAARNSLYEDWKRALRGKSPTPRMHETLESNYSPKTLAYKDTIKFLFLQAVSWGAAFFFETMQVRASSAKGLLQWLVIAAILAVLITLPKTLKALWLLLRNGSLEGNIRQVGFAVLESLHHIGLIKTGLNNIRIESYSDKLGVAYCRIEGATTIERSYFMEAMEEVLGAVDSPRYLLERRSNFFMIGRIDYHAVPAVLGQKKENAEYFARLWNRYVGSSSLIYTRSIEGRMTLLRARTKALSAAFRKKTDRVSRWQ